jgi:sugar/nucleoside kinase (ribokinase family)
MTSPDFVPDYLMIGHIAHDVTPNGPRLGGTVSFGAYTAAAFGLRVGILTSAAPGEPLLNDLPPQAVVINVPASHTTMFDNRYNGSVRTQYMYHRAETLTPEMLPSAWTQAHMVHLGPIAYEVAPAFAALFAGRSICVTPQGWMRRRETNGRVSTIPWDHAHEVLPHARLTVLSEEDIRHEPGLEKSFAEVAPLLVLTRAERGGTIYQQGTRRDFAAYPAAQIDPTGAGDIFATALLIALDRLNDIKRAVRVAAFLAAQSVTRAGFASAPTPAEVTQAWKIADQDGVTE